MIREGIQKVGFQNFSHQYVVDRFDAVVRQMKQHTAQVQKIALYLDIDNLPVPVRQELVGVGTSVGQDVGCLFGLALVHRIAPLQNGYATPM